MSTSSVNSQPSRNLVPVVRRFPFDPLRHANQFLEKDLVLTTSHQRGNPKLVFGAETMDGYVEAGAITFVPQRPATMAGPELPACVAITGRMAEYTDEQRQVLTDAGVQFKAKPGEKKTFYSAYITEARLAEATAAFENLKTRTGKACLLGQFTARGIALFTHRMADLKEESP